MTIKTQTEHTDLSILDDIDLIIFDGDGTLWEYKTWKLLPNVEMYFSSIHDDQHLALASNQGGVGTRYWMEVGKWGSPSEFPTTLEIESGVEGVLNQLGHDWFVSLSYRIQSKRNKGWSPVPKDVKHPERWEKNYRKPNAGMLEAAILAYGVSRDKTLMVGDWKEDLLASRNAGCHFIWAHDFFRRDK